MLTICNCILEINDQSGNAFKSAELAFEPRKTQVNPSDAIYLSRPMRSISSPGVVIQDLIYIQVPFPPVPPNVIIYGLPSGPTNTPVVVPNPVTIQYIGGGVAGSEIVTILDDAITVEIQSGVSTASQVLAAINASPGALTLVIPVLSGMGSNTQITTGVLSLTKSYCYLKLAETTTNSQECIFTLNYDNPGEDSGSIVFDPIMIPNQSFLDLSTLLTVSRG